MLKNKMNLCTCFVLFGTFAYVNTSPVTPPTEDKRGATLALKSVQEFNVKETEKTVIGDKKNRQPHSTVETFTDFIEELVTILNTYNDDIFEDFFNILDQKIRKYHYKGCKFYELKGKHEFRSLLAEQLDMLASKSVFEKRAFINVRIDMMKELNVSDKNVQKLLNYINFLYKDNAKEKFRQTLTGLKGYSGYGNTRTRNNFVSLIKECIRAAVFIHTHINTNVTEELKRLIAKIKEFPSSTPNIIAFKPTLRRANYYTAKIADKYRIDFPTEDKPPTYSSKVNPTSTTAHIKEKNKIIKIFKPADTSHEVGQENGTTTRDTFERDKSTSQQKIITLSSTNEAVTIVMFNMTTEPPGIVYKSESRSQLVQRMLDEKSSGKPATGKSTTTQEQRLSEMELKSSMFDELSILESFD